jgi:hypothetical protein
LEQSRGPNASWVQALAVSKRWRIRRTYVSATGPLLVRAERLSRSRYYYEKVMFSCAGGVVNVLAITYPKADKRELYDPVVEHMEDTFRPAKRCSS